MQPTKGVEPKMRGHKLRSGVNWHGALKQKGVQQTAGSGTESRMSLAKLVSYLDT
jgi:hypothetical protein